MYWTKKNVIYHVENNKSKEKNFSNTEKVCPNFWLVLYTPSVCVCVCNRNSACELTLWFITMFWVNVKVLAAGYIVNSEQFFCTKSY